jgi:peptide/nickel transport system permease protein
MADQHIQYTTSSIKQERLSGRTSNLHHFITWWFLHSNLAVNLSVVVLIFITLMSVFAHNLSPHSPNTIDLRNRMRPPAWVSEGGSWSHPFGTDRTGRDVLSRTLHGGRVSLLIGTIATITGFVVGTVLGLISGYVRGWFEQLIMYLIDVQLSLPFILLAIAVVLILGNSVAVLIGIAALSAWPFYARVVRGSVLSLRKREFTLAAQALGASPYHIIRVHLLPNVLSPILVIGTLSLARIILLESGLSFLGIGVPPSIPSWGNMIDEGRGNLNNAAWIALTPSIVLMLLTMAVGTLGDWLRDITDVTIHS